MGHTEYLKLWKVLFYSLWMADKPAYQIELAMSLGDMWLDLHCVAPEAGLAYARAFWETLCREWTSIDRLRLDKYYNLLRRFLAASYEVMRESGWSVDHVRACGQILAEWPLNPKRADVADSLRFYALENFMAILKWALASGDARIEGEPLLQALLQPYLDLIAQTGRLPVLKTAEEAFLPSLSPECLDLALVASLCMARGEKEDLGKNNRRVLYAAASLLKAKAQTRAQEPVQ